jgi:hypothetical protein
MQTLIVNNYSGNSKAGAGKMFIFWAMRHRVAFGVCQCDILCANATSQIFCLTAFAIQLGFASQKCMLTFWLPSSL